MSLKSCRFVRVAIVLSLFALGVASCAGQPETPTSPSRSTPITGMNGVVQEYWITMADETPAPAPVPPPSAPVPEPPPPPAGGTPTAPGPGGNTGAWPPGPPPLAAPGVPVPTPPSTHPRVSIKIDPEPVRYSGKPITDVASCRILPHTWYYDVYVHGETGVKVNFSERENFFDGRFTSRSGGFELGPNGTVILHVRWCSGYPRFHYTQHRLKGKDEYGEPVTINTPWIRLYAPGTN